MLRDCGKKCFLGKKKGFPICKKGTCEVNHKGLYAAYVRARQMVNSKTPKSGYSKSYYSKIAMKAKSMLKRRGYKVGA